MKEDGFQNGNISGLRNMIEQNNEQSVSMIQGNYSKINDSSMISHSFLLPQSEEERHIKDQYDDNDDVGFDLYEIGQSEFQHVAEQIAEKFDFPNKAVAFGKKSLFVFLLDY